MSFPSASKTLFSPETPSWSHITVLDQQHWQNNTFTQRRSCRNWLVPFLSMGGKKMKTALDGQDVREQRWHLTKRSPSSDNVQNCKFTAQRIKPHHWVLCSCARQVQALGFIPSEVKWKEFTYSCCSTLNSITPWVQFAAFAYGER